MQNVLKPVANPTAMAVIPSFQQSTPTPIPPLRSHSPQAYDESMTTGNPEPGPTPEPQGRPSNNTTVPVDREQEIPEGRWAVIRLSRGHGVLGLVAGILHHLSGFWACIVVVGIVGLVCRPPRWVLWVLLPSLAGWWIAGHLLSAVLWKKAAKAGWDRMAIGDEDDSVSDVEPEQ